MSDNTDKKLMRKSLVALSVPVDMSDGEIRAAMYSAIHTADVTNNGLFKLRRNVKVSDITLDSRELMVLNHAMSVLALSNPDRSDEDADKYQEISRKLTKLIGIIEE